MSVWHAAETVTSARPPPSQWIVAALAVVLATLILLLPAIANGSPFIFFDSGSYFQIGQKILGAMIHAGAAADTGLASAAAAAPASVSNGGLAAIAGGRSPTYSTFLVATATLLGMWTTAALQALVCAALIVRFWRFAWGFVPLPVVLGSTAFLAVASGLGFHAAFMMPDVFAGCLLLTLAIFLFDGKGRWPGGWMETLLLIGGIFLFASAHATNLILVLAGMVASVAIGLVQRWPLRAMLPRLGVLTGVVVAVIATGALYTMMVQKMSGHVASSPPYLMARVIADGPGEAYLAHACTASEKPFAACVFAGHHFPSQDAFLWGGGEQAGSFAGASPELKSALLAEEKRFLAAALAYDPFRQIAASFGNFSRQLFSAGLGEIDGGAQLIVRNPDWADNPILAVTPEAQKCRRDMSLCHPAPWYKAWKAVVSVINALVLPAFSVLALAVVAVKRKPGVVLAEATTRMVEVCVFLAILAVANAALCGVLSGPNDRYQTRLIWSLALALIGAVPLLWRARTSRPAR